MCNRTSIGQYPKQHPRVPALSIFQLSVVADCLQPRCRRTRIRVRARSYKSYMCISCHLKVYKCWRKFARMKNTQVTTSLKCPRYWTFVGPVLRSFTTNWINVEYFYFAYTSTPPRFIMGLASSLYWRMLPPMYCKVSMSKYVLLKICQMVASCLPSKLFVGYEKQLCWFASC